MMTFSNDQLCGMRSRHTRSTLLLLALVLGAGVKAQGRFGPKLGGTYTVLSDPLDRGYDREDWTGTGMLGGFFFQARGERMVTFRAEVLYAVRRTRNSYTTEHENGEHTSRLAYLQIPAFVVIHRGPGPYGLAGTGLAVLASALTTDRGTTTVSGSEQPFERTNDSKDALNSFQMGVVLGLGYQWKEGPELDLRYWRGLSNILYGPGSGSSHHNVIEFTLGFNLVPAGT